MFLAYTALFGNIDPNIMDPVDPYVDENIYICFTDRKDLKSDIWQIVYLDPDIFFTSTEPRLKARYMKIMLPNMRSVFHMLGLEDTFPDRGDVFLWVDSSIRIHCNPSQVAMEYGDDRFDIMAFRHPDRVELEREAIAAHKRRGTNLTEAENQVKHYRAEGFTKEIQNYITTTGFLFRRQSDRMQQFSIDWWEQIVNFTNRDQLSVDYCAWKNNIIIKHLPHSHKNSPLVCYRPH